MGLVDYSSSSGSESEEEKGTELRDRKGERENGEAASIAVKSGKRKRAAIEKPIVADLEEKNRLLAESMLSNTKSEEEEDNDDEDEDVDYFSISK